ncbi:hypothetical protein A9Q99_16520 [Gammaproteobacteria bacterium 45_16_T64]|nr:hypothetical protein A9Q99_16520 [Gammaproteobacteria bacterium 45_16_T64]
MTLNFASYLHRLSRIIALLTLGLAIPSTGFGDAYSHWFSDLSTNIRPSASVAKWKFSHPAPPSSPIIPVLQRGFKRLENNSQKTFLIKEYGGGVLHGQLEAFRALRRGISDYSACYGSLESSGFEYTKVINQYGVSAQNPLVTTRILAELAPKYFSPEFEAKGVFYGSSAASAPSKILSKKPIKSINDLKGLKLITHGIHPDAAKYYGYTTVNISFTDTYTALQQGIVDGVIGIDPAFIAFKLFEVAKNLTLVNITGAAIDQCISQKSFNRLSAQNKLNIYQTLQPLMMAMAKQAVKDVSKQADDIYRSNGVNLITPSESEMIDWNRAGTASRKPWLDHCAQQGKQCTQLLKEIEVRKLKYKRYTDDELMTLSIEHPVQGVISSYRL